MFILFMVEVVAALHPEWPFSWWLNTHPCVRLNPPYGPAWQHLVTRKPSDANAEPKCGVSNLGLGTIESLLKGDARIVSETVERKAERREKTVYGNKNTPSKFITMHGLNYSIAAVSRHLFNISL